MTAPSPSDGRQRGRTPIESFAIQGWQNGWMPNLQQSGMPPDSVFDLLNVVWNDDYTLSKRHGYTNIASAVTGLDGAADFVLAPRVYTQDGASFPQYTQQVLYFEKTNGEMWTQSLGKLWEENEDAGNGDDLAWSNESIGSASDGAINRFRVWPITAVTFDEFIYVSSLRFGGYDENTDQGDETASGNWMTKTGAKASASLPIKYDVENETFSRPALHDIDGTDGGFLSCRTMIAKYARIFAGNVHNPGVYRYPSRIYWCGTDDAEDGIEPELWEADNYIEVGSDDGQEIVALQSFGDQIIVLKNQSIWTLVGTDDTTFALYQLDDQIGTEGTYASCSTAGMLYLLDERTGVWQYDGSEFVNISLPVKDKLIGELNREAAYKVTLAVHDGLLYVSIPTGTQSTAVQSVTYVYDTDLGTWTRWDYGIVPSPFPMYSDLPITGPNVALVNNMFGGRPAVGVFQFNDALNDDGSAISSYVTTPWFSPGSLADRHRLRRLEVVGSEDDAEVTVDVFVDLEFDTAKSTVTYDLATGTENALQTDMEMDSYFWTYLCLRFTQNGDDEDMNLYTVGLSYSSRPTPRGIRTRTGYSN